MCIRDHLDHRAMDNASSRCETVVTTWMNSDMVTTIQHGCALQCCGVQSRSAAP